MPQTYYVYVIRCKTAGHYYVGSTNNLERRVQQHIFGMEKGGAEFTEAHGVDCVVHVEEVGSKEAAEERERELTLEYMRRYGVAFVAGAEFCELWKNYSVDLDNGEKIFFD